MYNGSKCRLFAEVPTKISRRIAAIAAREVRQFVAIVAMRAAQAENTRGSRPSFRPLTDSEAEALLGVELLMALSGARRQ